MSLRYSLCAGVLGAAMLGSLTVKAAEYELPGTMVWTAYGTGTSGYAQAVAIGNMMKEKAGTSLRVLPGKNDISRMTPLKAGRADFCACGIASYFGQEGVFLFAKDDWGPQPIRMVMSSIGNVGFGLGAAADSGVQSVEDLRGKRIAWVRGADAINVISTATLAFAGLTWDDVEKVEFSGYTQSIDGVLNDQADVVFMASTTPFAKKLATSPRGLVWPDLPHDDAAGWERANAVTPYLQQIKVTSGAAISTDEPWIAGGYAYPILVGNADADTDMIYNLTKFLVEQYDGYKDKAPGAKGWALENQNLEFVMPYHEGAVRYFKESGVWTAAHDAHNERLIERQNVLADAWTAFSEKGVSDDDFRTEWMKARADALTAAGFEPIFQ